MQGSLRQRRDKNGKPYKAKNGQPYWELRVYLGRNPLTGRPMTKTRGFAGTRREADTALRKLVKDAETGRLRNKPETLNYLLEGWFTQRSPGWSPLTSDRYRNLIDLHIAPTIGTKKLDKLGPVDLDRLYRHLLDKGLAPSTVRKVHFLLSGALRQGMAWDWIERNPADKASKPVIHRQEVRAPSPDQVLAAIAAAQRRYPGFPMYLRLAATTGARRGELVALRIPDVSPDGSTVRITRAVIEHKGKLIVKHTKTEDARVVTLDDDTAAMLAGHIDYLRTSAAAQGVELIPDAYLFSEPMRSKRLDGSVPWRPREATRRWSWLRAQAGAPNLRLHALRHFAATQMLDAGVPVRTVSARLGHRQTSTTLNVYSAFVPASDQLAADAIGRRLSVTPEGAKAATHMGEPAQERGAMKLAGMMTRSAGYPLDDPPVIVAAAIRYCLDLCDKHGIDPIGSFEMSVAESRFDDDEAVRWEFSPTGAG